MASLAQGFRLSPVGFRSFTSFLTTSRTRLISTTHTLHAAKPSKLRPPPSPTSRYAFIKSLASKPTPTTLYEGPSHFWFYFGCWSSGLSILAWTALTAPSATRQPEGVAPWVGYTFGASYILLGSMGLYLITKTPNIVARIRVLPVVQAPRLAPTGAVAAVVPTTPATSSPLQMEVTVKRMLPLLSPKILTTPIENVTLTTRFSLPESLVPELQRRAAAEKAAKAQRKFDMEHLMTMPFRQFGRALAAMFNGIKAAWTDMGYGVMRVDGKMYKVDVTKGFAHDGFRTLEKLVEIKP